MNDLGTQELPEAVPFSFRVVARASVTAKPDPAVSATSAIAVPERKLPNSEVRPGVRSDPRESNVNPQLPHARTQCIRIDSEDRRGSLRAADSSPARGHYTADVRSLVIVEPSERA